MVGVSRASTSILSESEAEEEQAAGGGEQGASEGTAMAQAVTQLTKLVKSLSKDRRREEDLLSRRSDGSFGGQVVTARAWLDRAYGSSPSRARLLHRSEAKTWEAESGSSGRRYRASGGCSRHPQRKRPRPRPRQRKAKCLRPKQLNAARHTHSSLSQSRCPAAADTDCQSLSSPGAANPCLAPPFADLRSTCLPSTRAAAPLKMRSEKPGAICDALDSSFSFGPRVTDVMLPVSSEQKNVAHCELTS